MIYSIVEMVPVVNFVIAAVVRILGTLMFLWFHPFVVHILYRLLDGHDYLIWQFSQTPFDISVYNHFDRALDLTYYVAALIYLAYFYHQLWYARWCIPFVAYRIIGNVVTFIWSSTVVFIIFPDVFSLLFLLYTFMDIWMIDLNYNVKNSFDANMLFVFLLIIWGVVGEINHHQRISNILAECVSYGSFDAQGLTLASALVAAFGMAPLGVLLMPNFEPGTVKRNRAGVFVKTEKGKELDRNPPKKINKAGSVERREKVDILTVYNKRKEEKFF